MFGGIRFYTAHRSKGTEAEHVILLDIISGVYGFPCELEDPTILEIAKRSKTEKPLEEERRLFYVALTRGKKQLYIYTCKNAHSRFLKELSGFLEPMEKIEFIQFIV